MLLSKLDQWRIAACLATLVLVLPALSGCPNGGDSDGEPPAGDTPAKVGTTATVEVASGGATEETGNWVRVPAERCFINDVVTVEYRLEEKPEGSEPWLAMVPAGIESDLVADNEQAAVKLIQLVGFPQGQVTLRTNVAGDYVLRLFPWKEPQSRAIAEAPLTIHPSMADALEFTVPYVALSGQALPDEVVFYTGQAISPSWTIEEPVPEDAWVGMVPTSCTAKDGASNYASAVATEMLVGRYRGYKRFPLKVPGEYTFRLFDSTGGGGALICESELFTVVEN
jgi:hypothetical protein